MTYTTKTNTPSYKQTYINSEKTHNNMDIKSNILNILPEKIMNLLE